MIPRQEKTIRAKKKQFRFESGFYSSYRIYLRGNIHVSPSMIGKFLLVGYIGSPFFALNHPFSAYFVYIGYFD